MKKYLRYLWLGALALTVGLTGCSDDDPEPGPTGETPEIFISDVKATATSVEFVLSPLHAVRYTYSVAPKDGTGDLVEVKSDKASTQLVEGLTADQVYEIRAVAYAADGTKSEESAHEFTTTSLASVSISKNVVVTFCTAELRITPTNAQSVSVAFYRAAEKPAKLDWQKVENVKGTFPVLLEGLNPETEYVLEAYATNADGDGPVAKSAPFRTEVAPTVEIGKVIASTKTAIVKFTPAAATGFKYVCYLAGQRPAEPDWTDVPQNEATEVTIQNLTPKTEYVIEAVAYTAAGEGAPVTQTFRTTEAPMLEAKIAATSNTVWASFEMNRDKTSGYYYSLPIDPTDEWNEFTTSEGFLADIDNNAWAYTLMEENTEAVMQVMPSTAYKLFAVCLGSDGKPDPATVQEYDVTTPGMDYIGQGSATMEIASVVSGSIDMDVSYTFSENCIMYVGGVLKKSDVDAAGGIQTYINMNLSTLYPQSAAMQQGPRTFNSLSPETDYYVYAIAIDGEGKFGQLLSQVERTGAVSYDPNVTAEVTVHEQGFTSMIFDVSLKGAETVRYSFISQKDFSTNYGSDDEAFAELFSDTADEMMFDNGLFQLNYLTYNTAYYLFVLPVKQDGSFGTRAKIEFSTAKYEPTGTASVTFDNVVNNPEGGGTMTITPSANCTKFVYMELGDEVYDNYRKTLGEYILSASYVQKVDPAEPTEIEVMLWGEGSHIVVIACDEQGRWSEPYEHYFALP